MMIVTGARRKSRLASLLKRVAAAIILAGFGFIPGSTAEEVRPAPYWYDEETGIAIGGFDPLSYFIYNEPRVGRADNEYALNGLTWRFVNPGNRDAFAEAVSVYAPAFGGYDVVGVARGVLTEGNPVIWEIHDRQLLFFYSPAHKELFGHDSANYLAKARENWPALARKAPLWVGQTSPRG